jgi:excisionase family DNA binding protein
MQPEAVSVATAAQMIGIGLTKTYDLINGGQLQSVKIGRRRLIRVESIRRLTGAELQAA